MAEICPKDLSLVQDLTRISSRALFVPIQGNTEAYLSFGISPLR